MNERCYVATDREGVQHLGDSDVEWELPTNGGSAVTTSSTSLTVMPSAALLDALDELIFVAEPGPATEITTESIPTHSATLHDAAHWDVINCARFALDCAEHVATGYTDVPLPGDITIGDVIDEARGALDEMEASAERRLGRLARIATVRRLRRHGNAISDVALELLTEDTENDIAALDDPSYALTAALVDAVLASTEAVRHIAMPHYTASREDPLETHSDSVPSVPTIITTPWGPIAIGAEHHSPYEPAWIAARDAAARARDAVLDREGQAAADAERAWQADRLEIILAGG